MRIAIVVLMLVLTVAVWADDTEWYDGAKPFIFYIGNIWDTAERDSVAYLGIETVVDSVWHGFSVSTGYDITPIDDGSAWNYWEIRSTPYLKLRINTKTFRIELKAVAE